MGDSPHYTADNLCYILGIKNSESVKRLGRKGIIPGKIPGIRKHLYLKERVDEWIQTPSKRAEALAAGQGLRTKNPAEALQDEAYARCKKGDHAWFDDSRFDGLAYRCEPSYKVGTFGIEARHFSKTCYFCGYTQTGMEF